MDNITPAMDHYPRNRQMGDTDPNLVGHMYIYIYIYIYIKKKQINKQ